MSREHGGPLVDVQAEAGPVVRVQAATADFRRAGKHVPCRGREGHGFLNTEVGRGEIQVQVHRLADG